MMQYLQKNLMWLHYTPILNYVKINKVCKNVGEVEYE